MLKKLLTIDYRQKTTNCKLRSLNTIVGWKYKMELESGIKEMYKWYLN